ncbi:MAG TPA: TolC family protein [Anaeromyxobacteraceae bacterium]|nr:TolC family protein [Anaeromyxobacteraceae bacterium]
MTPLAALLLAALPTDSGTLAPPAPPGGLEGMPPAVTLTLEESLALLDRQNPTLEEARARAAQALAVVRQVAAPLLPTLGVSGQYYRNRNDFLITFPSIPGLPTGTVYFQPLDAWAAGGSLRVPLIVPEAWFALAASRDAALASQASAEATRLTLRATLLQTAWVAWAGEEIVAASERALEAAREQAQSSRRQVQVGTATPLSVLQAETAATRRESDLVAARSEAERARIAVGALLGRSEPVRIAMPGPGAPVRSDVPSLSAEALDHRPELRATAAVVRSYQKQAQSAWWRLAPHVSASGTASAQNVPYPTGYREAWQVTVDLTWTLYDGGYRYGLARQAEAQADEARAADTRTRIEVVEEVQNSARDVEVARERLRLATQERATAAEAAASARRGFREGISSSLDVITANQLLFESEVQVADSGARLGAALAALDRAVGRSP